jgi:hypothetical protein
MDVHGVPLLAIEHAHDELVAADSSDGDVDDHGFTALESSAEHRQTYQATTDPAGVPGDHGSYSNLPDSQKQQMKLL